VNIVNMKYIASGAVSCIAAGVVTLLFLRFGEPNRPADINSLAQTSNARIEEPSLIATPSATIEDKVLKPSAQRPGLSHELRKRLSAATDWRSFAFDAVNRPEEGGYFYATYVANLCGRDSAAIANEARTNADQVVRATGSISMERIEAVNKWSTLCASFTRAEVSDFLNALHARAADGRDPLLAARGEVSRLLRSTDRDALRNAVGALLATDDLLALAHENLIGRVMARSPEADRPGGAWFDGRLYAHDTSEFSQLLMAIDLAMCDATAPCPLDDLMLISCTGSVGTCTNDRTEFIRGRYEDAGVDPSAEMPHVLDLTQRIRDAIARKDASAFVQ
jgi:hypothetical protein